MSCLHRGDMTSFIPKTTYCPSSLRATHFFLHYLLPPPHQHSSSFQSMLASFFFTKVPFRMAQHICFFQMDFWPKNGQIWPKLAFSAKYQHFWPVWSNAWPKNNADKLPKWFSVMLVPKLLLNPIKIRLFGPKMAKFGQKSSFLVILGQILAFLAHIVQCPTKNNADKLLRCFFVMWVPKLFTNSHKYYNFGQ